MRFLDGNYIDSNPEKGFRKELLAFCISTKRYTTYERDGKKIIIIDPKAEIALEVLKRAFIDRDPTVVDQYFAANYKQHNPVIADGQSAIARMIPTLTGLTYEPGMAVADGDLVIAVDIFRLKDGKVAEHWDVLQEEVAAANTASGNAMFTKSEWDAS